MSNRAITSSNSRPQRNCLVEGLTSLVSAKPRLEAVILLIGILTIAKLIIAAIEPITFDEALYWRYSKHLAAGYIDHPFANPLAIRIGTSIFGNTPFGVRVVSILSSLVASFVFWKAGRAVFADRAIATTALLYLNLTVIFTSGAMLATSDQMVVTAACFLLWALAKLQQTGDPRWWVGAGIAFGLGLCAKYTTIFFAVGIMSWVITAPERRRWLLNFWAWAGAGIALVIFSPVLLWNAHHQWASFIYQSGRLTVYKLTIRYTVEFVGSLVLLGTPVIFGLGVIGAYRLARGEAEGRGALLVALMVPLPAYLLWHSTHQRVQGNWSEPVFPSLAMSAAYAAHWPGPLDERRGTFGASVRLAAPVALALTGLVYLSAVGLMPPIGRHDLRARALGVGWKIMAPELDDVRRRTGAGIILTTDYTLASWTRFYLPSSIPIEQVDERIRWSNEPAPPVSALQGAALYICKEPCAKLGKVTGRYRSTKLESVLQRRAGSRVVDRYRVYLARGPERSPLDPADHLPLADHAE